MRMFVAVVPPSEALQELETAVTAQRATVSGLRWTSSSQWHVTLAFLPDVPGVALPDLTDRLRRAAARGAPFGMRIAGAGAFPSRRRARVLWAGVETDGDTLVHLAGASSAAAVRAKVEVVGRRFHPHLTLARAPRPLDLTACTSALGELRGTPWTVGEMQLIASYLGEGAGGRPRYETVQRFDLGARQRTDDPTRPR